MRLRSRVICSSSACDEQRVGGQLLLAEQVVVQRQVVEVAPRFLDRERLDRLAARSVSSAVLAPQPLERRHDLVAEEAVALVERRDEDVHRSSATGSAPACRECGGAPRCPRPDRAGSARATSTTGSP